jgi:hypothetical protein
MEYKLKYTTLIIFSILILIFSNKSIASDSSFIIELKMSCQKDHFESCGQLGVHYRDKENDLNQAIPFYKKACQGGRSGSCVHLSSIFSDKIPDPAKRLKYAKLACDLNEPIGCLLAGLSISVDKFQEEEASSLFLKACELKNGEGCFYFGENLEADANYDATILQRANDFFKKGCDLKNEPSCKKIEIVDSKILAAKACDIKDKELTKLCNEQDCSKEVLIHIGSSCLNSKREALIWQILENSCRKFKANACHEVAGLALVSNQAERAIFFSKLGCEFGNHYSCAINKYVTAFNSIEDELVKKTIGELSDGCFKNKEMGYCQLAYSLAFGKKLVNVLDLKKLSLFGCDLKSPILCQVAAGLAQEKADKVSFLDKACEYGNYNSCLEAGSLLKEGNLVERYRALKFFRLSCAGHLSGDPAKDGCADAALMEARFYNLLPSGKTLLYATLALGLILGGWFISRKVRQSSQKLTELDADYAERKQQELLDIKAKMDKFNSDS